MPKTPKISVVIVAFNMARELPRTIQSFSCKMQKWISEDQYEIIVVDNGSYLPFDESACREHANNISFFYMEDATKSPVPAINMGLSLAKGDIIGVCVDGARMASPGLLRMVLDASNTSETPVIGTLSFHLGHEPQMKAVHNGYNQTVEDELLTTVPWQDNGYHLFEISVAGGSSQSGWFEIPAETNALFMRRKDWDVHGGFDEAFISKAGGLSNHDAWTRACALPSAQVIILLGEGTFHQFHGGAATNAKISNYKNYLAEYEEIRNQTYTRPEGEPISYGRLNGWAKLLNWSTK